MKKSKSQGEIVESSKKHLGNPIKQALCASDVERTPDVHLSHSALEDSVGALISSTQHLEGRLRPVTSESVEIDNAPVREGLCGVSQRVNCQVSAVKSAHSFIRDITTALEV